LDEESGGIVVAYNDGRAGVSEIIFADR